MGEEIPELYCRVFVNTDCTAEALSRVVREVLGGDGHGERIRIGLSAVDIQANGACDAERWSEPQTGFLYYPYYLDVIAFYGQTRPAHIGLTARLLRELWARGLAAVASCEYEQALPHDGRGGGGAL